jgi:CheY-like chemotaxis protein
MVQALFDEGAEPKAMFHRKKTIFGKNFFSFEPNFCIRQSIGVPWGFIVKILVVEDDETDAIAIRRELETDYEVTIVDTLKAAMIEIAGSDSRPDAIVADLSLPDSNGLATVRDLQQVARDIPIIVSTGMLTDKLREQIQNIGPTRFVDKSEGFSLLHSFLKHLANVREQLEATRQEIFAEIDKVAARAAEKAVETAIDQLLIRLHLHDEEAVRMAIRLARAWDTAKSRFFIAMANGFAAALLLAIGAGIAALIKNHSIK